MIVQRMAFRMAATQTIAPLCRTVAPQRIFTSSCPRLYSTAYPTVADSSFWKSLIPKPLRKENRKVKKKAREWNPATYFIVMFLFVGSMSIQMIALRNQTVRYMRQAGVRLELLREVVERIQNGEDVDVEKVLGTGEPQKEADWEEVLKAIEQEEATKQSTPKDSTKPKKEPVPEPTKAAAVVSESNTENAPSKSSGFGSFF